jgi:peptidoglycan/xylan/chitin deacetylase (PgdA/CDA1 family)
LLAYHQVAEDGPPQLAPFRVSPALFKEQMRFLRDRGYYSISVPEWAFCVATRRCLLGRPVAITFDDGYTDFAANAWPVLKEMDFRATVFVVASRVGSVADWNREADPPPALLGWAELRALHQAGTMIASHCNVHRDLTGMSDEEIVQDAAEARAAFRRELATEVTCVAFPWGKSDSRVRLALGQAGYVSGVGITGELSTLGDEPLNLPRIEIFGGDNVDIFARKIEADRPPAEQAAAQTISKRIDRLISELTSIRQYLLTAREPPQPVAVRLAQLFAKTEPSFRRLTPFQQICRDVRVGFEGTARVRCSLASKPDESASPPTCIAAVRLSFAPPSRWCSIDSVVQWPELEGSRRFQLEMSVAAERDVTCRAVLRVWQKDGQLREVSLTEWSLVTTERHYNLSGTLVLPDMLEIDYDSDPLFVLLFDTASEFNLEIYYLNLYFS